jgi:hypothetical protein
MTSTENNTEKRNTNVENARIPEDGPKPIASPLLEALDRDEDGKSISLTYPLNWNKF